MMSEARVNKIKWGLLAAAVVIVIIAALGLSAQETKFPFKLDQNRPNPFTDFTTIKFSIPEAGHVELKVYNTLGQQMQTLLNDDKQQGGESDVRFDGNSLPSGQYTYNLTFTSATDGHVVK